MNYSKGLFFGAKSTFIFCAKEHHIILVACFLLKSIKEERKSRRRVGEKRERRGEGAIN